MYKCINCDWEGNVPAKHKKEISMNVCPICGDNVTLNNSNNPKQSIKEEVNLDLNGDGVVDKKDASIASRVMNRVKNKNKNKRSKR